MANDRIEIQIVTEGDAKGAEEIAKGIEKIGDKAAEATPKVQAATAAVENLGQKADVKKLVPAWNEAGDAVSQAADAVKEAGSAMEGAGDSGGDLDEALKSVRSRADEARAKIAEFRRAAEEAKTAADGASGKTGGGGVKGLGGSLLTLAGGPIGMAIAAITGLAAWMESLKRRIDEAKGSVGQMRDRTQGMVDAFREGVNQSKNLSEEIPNLIPQIQELGDAYDGLSGQIATALSETNQLIEAQAALQKATIEKQAAEGKLTPEQAAIQKGEVEKNAAKQQADAAVKSAEERLAAVQAKIDQASGARTFAYEQMRQAPNADAGPVNQAYQQALAEARRAQDAVDQQVTKGPKMEDFAIYDPGTQVSMFAAAQSEQAKLVEELKKEAQSRTDQAVKLKDLAQAEAGERQKVIDSYREQFEAADAEVKALRNQQAQATSQYRAADFQKRIADGIGAATIDQQTGTELAKIEAKKKEEAEAAAKKKAKEEEQAAKEAEMQRIRDQQAALQDQIRGGVPGLYNTADRADAAGFPDAAVSAIENVARGSANGAGVSELQSMANAIGRVMQQIPEQEAARTRAILKPIYDGLKAMENKQKQLEAHVADLRNR